MPRQEGIKRRGLGTTERHAGQNLGNEVIGRKIKGHGPKARGPRPLQIGAKKTEPWLKAAVQRKVWHGEWKIANAPCQQVVIEEKKEANKTKTQRDKSHSLRH
ncbi:hypothetical protein F5888DRAFT_1641060 [Russula emetica]|nr:hypothetical protein F5888DRAFT_1641060 [Russula emetica]